MADEIMPSGDDRLLIFIFIEEKIHAILFEVWQRISLQITLQWAF